MLDKPAPTKNGRKLSYSDAITGTVAALYSESLWKALNRGLAELKFNGSGTILKRVADLYYGRGKDGTYSGIMDAHLGVVCVDEKRVTDPARMKKFYQRYVKSAPFMDPGKPIGGVLNACAYWPVPVTGDKLTLEPGKLPTTLVISTTGDPATPYESGVQLAEVMGARLLTFEGTQHTVFLHGNKCVDSAAISYLVNLKLPAEGTRCS